MRRELRVVSLRPRWGRIVGSCIIQELTFRKQKGNESSKEKTIQVQDSHFLVEICG